jgi:hypothetical protein
MIPVPMDADEEKAFSGCLFVFMFAIAIAVCCLLPRKSQSDQKIMKCPNCGHTLETLERKDNGQ